MPLEIKKDFLGNIISESDGLAEIINDILYLDKLEAGTTPLNLELNNITEAYHKALKPLHQLFDQKNLHHSEVNLLKNEFFYFDEMKMIQLFQNILGNSLKFANEQGMVQTKFQEKEGMLKISMFNTGKKSRKKIWNSFLKNFIKAKTKTFENLSEVVLD